MDRIDTAAAAMTAYSLTCALVFAHPDAAAIIDHALRLATLNPLPGPEGRAIDAATRTALELLRKQVAERPPVGSPPPSG